MSEQGGIKIICENRKARFSYEIIETFEAGLVLTGAEIKSVRQGGVSLGESYVRPDKAELLLINAHIQPYAFESRKAEYDPIRKRKLLLNRREIDKLRGGVERKGLTIIPLKMYLKRGLAKLEIALAKGKASADKRQSVKDRDAKREAARAMKRG